MKLQDILAMEAGLNLDELIAEIVFGHCVSTADHPLVPCKKCGLFIDKHTEIKNYSTHISAAYEIINKLPSFNMFFELKQWPEGWQITVVKNKGTYRDYMVGNMHFKSFTDGICKAALIAILRERGELTE